MRYSIMSCFAILLLAFCSCRSIQPEKVRRTFDADAEVTKTREKVNPARSELMRTRWFRNGVEILRQNDPNNMGVSVCTITPFNRETGNVALSLFFKAGRLSSASSGPALKGYDFAIDDFTKDGVPDLIQVTHTHHKQLIEAYSIVEGVVEPIPSKLFKKDGSEFYFDPDVVEYLQKKIEQENAG